MRTVSATAATQLPRPMNYALSTLYRINSHLSDLMDQLSPLQALLRRLYCLDYTPSRL